MTLDFIPDRGTHPSSCSGFYLSIEDTQGRELYQKSFQTEEALDRTFQELKPSKRGFSNIEFTVFPVRLDSPTHFFQSLCIPNTHSICSELKGKIERVVVGIFMLIVDLVTLPIRAITAIPYILYRSVEEEPEHKVIAYIRNHPLAAQAISEGKVILRASKEQFFEVQPGTQKGQRVVKLSGEVSSSMTEVYIKRPFWQSMESSFSSSGRDGFFKPKILTYYQSLKHLAKTG